LVDLACGESKDHRRGMCRIGRKRDIVSAQKDHHGVEGDPLVAVHKGMVTGKTERIGCRKVADSKRP